MLMRILQQVEDGRLELPYIATVDNVYSLKHEVCDNSRKEKKESKMRQHRKSVSGDKNSATAK